MSNEYISSVLLTLTEIISFYYNKLNLLVMTAVI